VSPEDLEDVKINTEDYGSILLEFDSGAHGSLTVNQCAAGRKNRLYVEIDGATNASLGNQIGEIVLTNDDTIIIVGPGGPVGP
jgi:hypothetical protein